MTGLDKNMSRYANVHWLFEWNKKPYLRHDVWNHVIGYSTIYMAPSLIGKVSSMLCLGNLLDLGKSRNV